MRRSRSGLDSVRATLRTFALAAAAALAFSAAGQQPVYRTVTPDGRVVYSDTPPSGPPAGIRAVPGATPPAVAPVQPVPSAPPGLTPPAHRLSIVPGVELPPRGEIMGAIRSGPEMDAYRECSRANSRALELIKASEELVRTVASLQRSGSAGASTHLVEQRDRQWRHYQSLGGAAATPEAVRVPDDPCRSAREAVRAKTNALEAQYRQCAAVHEKEIQLARLSREVVRDRGLVTVLERAQEERRRNPGFDAANKGGEWAAAFKADPALARAQLAVKFQEYRSRGGPASRVEEVTEIPDPCVPPSTPSRPAVITDRKAVPVPAR